jgi:Fe-S-cluster-containing hydrogenase component 2
MKHEALKITGMLSTEELNRAPGFPKPEDFLKGATVVIECVEEIPCNPCETACPKGAITVGKPITNLPTLDAAKCVGCGMCIAACPGLAIYIKDLYYSEKEALIVFPYEFLPLPKMGEIVTMVGRKGEEICKGRVVQIHVSNASNRTVIIGAAYDKKYFEDVVTMKLKKTV